MTNYAYACEYWTFQAPEDCVLLSSLTGIKQEEGWTSSSRDCPCYMKDTYLMGNPTATLLVNTASECRKT